MNEKGLNFFRITRFRTKKAGVVQASFQPLLWKNFHFMILLIPLVLCQQACFEPKYGCLDIAATNFNPAADKDCCCRYPKLLLDVNQVYDTLVFRQDSLYPGTGGHLFRIRNVAFYLSDFQLIKDGVTFETEDVVDLKV